MTDREMMEWAAKAHGFIDDATDNSAAFGLHRDEDGNYYWIDGDGWVPWTPKDDDGQALRLAVKLHLWEAIRLAHRVVSAGTDIYAATRLAVTTTAAGIGRNLP